MDRASPILALIRSFPDLPQTQGSLIHHPPLEVLSPEATDPRVRGHHVCTCHNGG